MKEETRKQLKSAEEQEKQLNSDEQKEEKQLNPADELKPIEKARNGDVKIHVDAPPEKLEVKEEEVKTS